MVENKRKRRILLIVFGEILEIISDDVITNIIIIRILTIESFLIGIFSFLRNLSMLSTSDVKFSLIKKLLAPCRGLKKAEF